MTIEGKYFVIIRTKSTNAKKFTNTLLDRFNQKYRLPLKCSLVIKNLMPKQKNLLKNNFKDRVKKL